MIIPKRVHPYGECKPLKIKKAGSRIIKPLRKSNRLTVKEIDALPDWDTKLKEWGIKK